MKTDNSIVNSLEDAAELHRSENHLNMYNYGTRRESFKAGANWQKEQYKDLVQSHAELLKTLGEVEITLKYSKTIQLPHKGASMIFNSQLESVQKAIENAKKIQP